LRVVGSPRTQTVRAVRVFSRRRSTAAVQVEEMMAGDAELNAEAAQRQALVSTDNAFQRLARVRQARWRELPRVLTGVEKRRNRRSPATRRSWPSARDPATIAGT